MTTRSLDRWAARVPPSWRPAERPKDCCRVTGAQPEKPPTSYVYFDNDAKGSARPSCARPARRPGRVRDDASEIPPSRAICRWLIGIKPWVDKQAKEVIDNHRGGRRPGYQT